MLERMRAGGSSARRSVRGRVRCARRDERELRQQPRSNLRSHQRGHGQCAGQRQQPRRAPRADLFDAHQAQRDEDDRAHHQGTHGGFKQQMSAHDFFPFFDAAMRSARRCSSLRSSTAESTMPASSVSTDPSQNQSTMRCTARPATAWRDAAGRYRNVRFSMEWDKIALLLEAAQHGANGGFLERTALRDEMLAHLVGALHAMLPDEFENRPFQLAQLGRIVTLSSVTGHSVTDCNT